MKAFNQFQPFPLMGKALRYVLLSFPSTILLIKSNDSKDIIFMLLSRLRSRLIASFLGVALLAMLPLTLIPYYLHAKRQATYRNTALHNSNEFLNDGVKTIQYYLENNYLLPAHRYFQRVIQRDESLVSLLKELDENPTESSIYFINSWERHLNSIKPSSQTKWKEPDYYIKILSKPQYESMQTWMDQNRFYEEDNTVYMWVMRPLYVGKNKDSMEIVGALFLRSILLEKSTDPRRRETLPEPMDRNVKMIILPPDPSDFREYLPEDSLERLFDLNGDGHFEDVYIRKMDNPFIEEDELPIQAVFKPVLNQYGQTACVIALFIPIVDIWPLIGSVIIFSFCSTILIIILAAILIARSIVEPVFKLAKAADYFSQGNFDERVPVVGTIEQRVLSNTFNQMAERIQNQLEQLRQNTEELESSNHELAQTHRFLRNILTNISTGVMSLDRNVTINHVNQVGMHILHISEDCNGRSIQEIIPSPPFTELINSSLRRGIPIHQREIFYEVDGEKIPLQVSTVPTIEMGEVKGLVVTFHDLSEIRRLEEQVRRQERLAALGSMVAGVAHEIRNPLGIIRGSAELLKKRFGDRKEEAGLSEFIIDEVNRLSRVVNDFLMFARPPIPVIEPVEVETLIDLVLNYTKTQHITEAYEYNKDIQENLPPIAADTGLCKQVFLNLFINAQEAMPEGGSIIVRARKRTKKEVVIEIIDEGIGIASEQVERIFDPFYTSKDSGTGLGLSLVHQIVSSHGGKVEVESEPQKGSTFRVVFPVFQPVKTEPPVPVAS